TKDVLTAQERLVQAQSDAALLEQALNKGVAKQRDATDAQKRFNDQVAQLRDDSEARVQLAEERSRELVGKLADLMEQQYRMEEEKARLIEDLDQLKGKLDDRERKLARERDDLAGEVLGLRQQLEDKDLNELVKKHKSAVSQAAQISDLQAQLEEALKEKQEVQEKMQALQSQLEFQEQSTMERSQVGHQEAKVRELETRLEFEKAQVKRLEGLVASQKETQRNVELTAEHSHQQLAELRRRAQGA
ncbi:unnamed protein product, partial [Lota lota]